MNRVWLLFFVVSGIQLAALLFNFEEVRMLTKPMLIPVLMYYYVHQNPKPDRGILIALFFSFLGDVFLLGEGSLYFLLGLASFLATQILYVIKTGERVVRTRKNMILAGLPYGIYGLLLLILLYPTLGNLMPAVVLYAAVICAFGVFSLIYWHQKLPKRNWIAIGAFLFIVSDSMLAVNEFYFQSNFFGPGVMVTYLAAQGCITFFFKQDALVLSDHE